MSNIKKGAKLTVSTGNGISTSTSNHLGVLEVSGPGLANVVRQDSTFSLDSSNVPQVTIGAIDNSGIFQIGVDNNGNSILEATENGNNNNLLIQQLGGYVGIGTTNPASTFHVNSTDALIIPVGTTTNRPGQGGQITAVNGMIRYNTQTSQFEGYGPGSAWGSLGGVKDVDGDTYILAESSAGADNDDLQFFTAGQERMSINSVGDVSMNGDITTDVGYPYYQSLGTEKIVNPPSTALTVHGVNITAMNKRTRASYASAEACVETWTARSATEANYWCSVCWSPELSIFVAVANGGTNRVMTSPDGITWTARSAAEANAWRSVCWSPELSIFVAVANGGGTNRVMTSPDGITWTGRSPSEANNWQSVCWSPELSIFVAVAGSGTNRVMTSPDGITWTARSAAAANWTSVCWSPELSIFVAVAYTGGTNRVMTSPDGITWTARSPSEANAWHSVCWSPELSIFVAVAVSGTNRVMTSPDGITWTARSPSEANNWHSVCWSPELSIFVAVANTGTNRVMTSPDGITWTARSAAEANGWFSVCWSPELSIFVAVAYTGTNRVMTSNIGMPNSKSVVKALPTQMSVDANGNAYFAGDVSMNNNLYVDNIVGIGIDPTSAITLNVKPTGLDNGIKVQTSTSTTSVYSAQFLGNSGSGLTVLANGSVGIGTTSGDGSSLRIDGNPDTGSAQIYATGANYGIQVKTADSDTKYCAKFIGSTSKGLEVRSNGETRINGGKLIYNVTTRSSMTNANTGISLARDGYEEPFMHIEDPTDRGHLCFQPTNGYPDSSIIFKSYNNTSTWNTTGGFGTERMRIQHDGKVGIGTTTPKTALQIGAEGTSDSVGSWGSHNIEAGSLSIINNNVSSGTDTKTVIDMARFGKSSYAYGARCQIKIGRYDNAAGGSPYDAKTRIDFDLLDQNSNSSLNNVMSLQANGNVGIGTTSPSYKLEVNGGDVSIKGGKLIYDATSRSSMTNANSGISIGFGTYELPIMHIQDPTNRGHLCFQPTNGYTDSSIIFKSYSSSTTWNGTGGFGSERMRIQSDGLVGIGTPSPGALLHVDGNAQVDGRLLANYLRTSSNAYQSPGSVYGSKYYHSSRQSQYIDNYNTGYWCDSGSIMIKNGYLLIASDERIKVNITDVPDNLSLEMLRNIPCCYYEYKDKTIQGEGKTIGFIAQQVNSIFPLAVKKTNTFIPNEMRDLDDISWEEIIDGSNNKYKLLTDLQDTSGVKYAFYVFNDLSGNKQERKEIIGNSDNTFTFDTSYNYVFCRGKEVNDFHLLDKQKLFALNFSATQEIDRIQQQHIIDISNAQATIQQHESTIQQQATTIQQHETTIQQQQQQIADILSRLENLEATA